METIDGSDHLGSPDSGGASVNMDMDVVEVEAQQREEATTVEIGGDGYGLQATYGMAHGGTEVSTEAKFD